MARLPWLEIVDAAGAAEVVLEFGSGDLTAYSAYEMKGPLGITKQRLEMTTDYKLGRGQVVRRVSETVMRVLLKFQDPQFNSLERKPSTNFARAFLRAYERANDPALK